MKNKKAFTLIELLAVIVILAIILVITVPKISNAIEKSKKGALESSAKLIERDLERKNEASLATGSILSTTGSCMEGLNTNEYSDCTYEIDNKGKAHVTLTGANTGKFKNLVYMNGSVIKMQKVTITFNNNGGSNSTTTKEVLVGNTYGSLPLPTKTNNAFLGWYSDSEFTNKVTSKTIVSKESDHTLYAKYGTAPILSKSWVSILTTANSAITKATIGSVTFHDTSVGLTLSGTPVDVSSSTISGTGSANGSVLAYYTLNDSLYDIDIVADSKIYFPSNSNSLFSSLTHVLSLNFNDSIDASNVQHMLYMFEDCFALTEIDVSSFDTCNVTDMSYMFQYCFALTEIDVSYFDTSNVTNMSGMFRQLSPNTTATINGVSYNGSTNGINHLERIIGLENFDTSNVTTMAFMFEGLSNVLELDVSNFDTSNVTNMSSMFHYAGYNSTALEMIGLENFDTSKVTNMYGMFDHVGYNSPIFMLDVSNFDTSNVTNMSSMFSSAGRNSTTFTLDVSHFDTSNVTDMSYMFYYTGYKSTALNTSITILNPNVTSYSYMFSNVATKTGSQITVNYTAEIESLVDAMIATKSSGSNVVKGSLITN